MDKDGGERVARMREVNNLSPRLCTQKNSAHMDQGVKEGWMRSSIPFSCTLREMDGFFI